MSSGEGLVRPWIRGRAPVAGPSKEIPMAKFMFVFRGGGVVQKELSPAQLGAHLEKWKVWVGELARKGHHEAGGQLLDNAGKVVRGSAKTVIDGPFAESKDMVTGTMLILAESLEAATTIALGCPVYEFDGSVEVRAIVAHG
jgi:hypothetical protein